VPLINVVWKVELEGPSHHINEGYADGYEKGGQLVNTLHGPLLRDVDILFDVGTIGDRPDGELMKCFTTGDAKTAQLAFTAIVGRHGPMVLRACEGILHDPHDAEDAFQAVFIVLAHKASSLWVLNSLGPWLHRVACNVASCAKSTAALRRRHERRHAELTALTVSERQRDDLAPVLHEELDRLPERYRVPIVLCYLEGMTHEQAAHRLHWPVGTVRTRLARGRKGLQARLIRRGLAPSDVLISALSPKAVSAGVRQGLARSTVLAVIRYAAGRAASGTIPEAVSILVKGALSAMTTFRLKLFASSVFAVAVVACGVPVVVALAQAEGLRQTRPGSSARAPAAFQTPSAALVAEEPVVAVPFHEFDRTREGFSPHPNPYQPDRRNMGGPPGSLTIHLGPLRFNDRRDHSDKWMTLTQSATIVATATRARDRIMAYSTKRGGWQTYRVPVGVKFTPIVSDNALACYLTGESIPEVAVFSARLGVWNKQVLEFPAKGKLEPFMTPQIVLYGTGRRVYAYSTETNTWDALELAGNDEVQARLSGASVLVEDVRNNTLSIFAPGIGRWDTIETVAEAE
jgi:RNA polymerase sigma factor (sigma-70 family)